MTESVKPESSEPLTPKTHIELVQISKQLKAFIEGQRGSMHVEANRVRQQVGIPEIPARPEAGQSFKAKVPKDWMGRFFQVPEGGTVDMLTISLPGKNAPEQGVIVNAVFTEDVDVANRSPESFSSPSKEVTIPLEENEPTVRVVPETYVNGDGVQEESKLDELAGHDLLLDLQEILTYQGQTA